MQRLFRGRFALLAIIIVLYLAISLVTRVVLMFITKDSGFSVIDIVGSIGIGLFYDLFVAALIIIPLLLHWWFQNNLMYRRQWLPLVVAFYFILLFILLFTRLIPRDFSPVIYNALIGYVIFRLLVYLFLFFTGTRYRERWRMAVWILLLVIYCFVLILNCISEITFWNEFETRYNFIAVDYLVYTNEVIGNIRQSYPLGLIISGILIVTAALIYLSRKYIKETVISSMSFAKRTLIVLPFIIIGLVGVFLTNERWRQFSKNEFANELAGNGIYQFAVAFMHNELDYYKFYQTIPDSAAFAELRHQLSADHSEFVSNDVFDIRRNITSRLPEQKHNVVLISVESFSASFMARFGNTSNITPRLDSLANHSLLFTNLFATGTRTVRGLESLSLSIPPTPGQSIVKRPDNAGMFSLGSVFRSKGYSTKYIYGGYSYFDNMKTFFSGNQYEVIDRSAIAAKDVHYENIWGVADEDLFTLALKEMNADYAKGVPFFNHVMTVSNHRPYTFPENRIDLLPSSHSRDAAVKYTDYAIGDFIDRASKQPWFNNTIFIIVADHCASSAGKSSLPLWGYHIPMLIYAPGIVQPGEFNQLTAQIDVAPTILGLLHFNYESRFFGMDVLNSSSAKRRAFISTYQGLGYLKDDKLVVFSPIKKTKQYAVSLLDDKVKEESPTDSLVLEARSYYQTIAWLLKQRKTR